MEPPARPSLNGSSPTATAILNRLMAAVQIPSYRALARQAGVSDWAVQQLRRDRLPQMKVATIEKIAIALSLSLPELLARFGDTTPSSAPPDGTVTATSPSTHRNAHLTQLAAEYGRLQAQQQQQAEQLTVQLQREALVVLESWLVQWPTVVQAVAQNPDLPASRLVPLVEPVQMLLKTWGVEAIASVGATVPYNPQDHQSMQGDIAPGTPVKIRYTGFRHHGSLLHRAQVSPAD
ncbi:MAG: helix-turn-helix domain-containing protein [Leptolyngbyaceae cyanobacterium]